MDVPIARRVERPAWINRRTVLGVALFTVAFVAGQRAMESARVTVAVWTAARDIARGEVVGAEDLRLTDVRLPNDVLAGYAPASTELEGAIATRPVRAGELIALDWVADGATTHAAAMTLPVAPEHAVGGALRPGDRIAVLATFDAGDVRARTVYLARDLEILEVVTAGGLVVNEEGAVGVTVAVSPEEAGRLAFAIRTSQIDLVRIDGGPGGSYGDPVTGADF